MAPYSQDADHIQTATFEQRDFLTLLCVSLNPDHHADWPTEDGSPPAAGARRPQAGPLLRVRRRRAHAAHVHFCPHCTLVGLHLVRYWQRGEALPGAQDRLARQSGGVNR